MNPSPPAHQLIILALLMSLNLACSSYATARSISPKDLIITLVDDRGAQLPTYRHRGQTYVQGEHGERYQIRIYNRSRHRREVVVTVDGRDVINGQEGHYQHRGYIIDPHESVLIQGFRTSDSEVATFRFTSPSDSYSGRFGTKHNVGVIGVAVFEEKARPRPPIKKRARPVAPEPEYAELNALMPEPPVDDGADDYPSSSGAVMQGMDSPSSPAPTKRRSSAARSEIGTQYGEGRYSAVEEVQFKRRSSRPQRVYTLQYDSEQGLIRRGVITRRPTEPSAFPAEPRYAPPPP